MFNLKSALVSLFLFTAILCNAQDDPREGNARYFEPVLDAEVVYRGPDVVFRKISEGTWVGSGHRIASETLYLLEGKSRALLIDTGADIPGLDKIIRNLTDKPLTVVLTHTHGDHSGNVGLFGEIWFNPGDSLTRHGMREEYKGKVRYLSDGQKINLGGRTIEVLFAPGHTRGSTIFLDPSRGCGYSGSAFGSGNLNLWMDLRTFESTCKKTLSVMKKKKIGILYPGHYFGNNPDTPDRISAMRELASGVLSGNLTPSPNIGGIPGFDLMVSNKGQRICFPSSTLE